MIPHPPYGRTEWQHAAHQIVRLVTILLLQISVACSVPTATDAPASYPSPTPVTESVQAHDFTLTSLQGETMTLHELRGRWVILNFWATWCLPCREEMPYLQQIANTRAASVTVLGVNMREAPTVLLPFVEEFGITFPVLLHPDDAMLLAYGPRGLPLTYVISPEGEIKLMHFGPLKPAQFDAWLDEQIG